jgi:ubiquinone/menaquinone biosynthesis C-methylase UbiE
MTMSEAQLVVATTFTEIYQRVLVGPLFMPLAEQLVARLAPKPGDSLIDVACGTGIVARLARERLGPEARIVGVDVAPRCWLSRAPSIRQLTGVRGMRPRFR